MNPDREMQAEAMDEAQGEILRLTEALGAEKEAHMDTAKALVACREALSKALNDSGCDGDLCCYEWHQQARDALASTDAGDDYVSKASVKPLTKAALAMEAYCTTHPENVLDIPDSVWVPFCDALEQAKLLGLV